MGGEADLNAMRATARRLFDAGVAAADPAEAVRRSLNDAPVRPTRIIALGKAALPMLRMALRTLPPRTPAIAVTNAENASSPRLNEGLARARVLVGGHPVPDAAGLAAAREVEAFAREAGEDDTVLVLVSGGASAMLPAPIEGVSLRDKIAVTELLLASGAPIDEINAVRRGLSRLKGGGLARAIHPARTVALLLSDVPHDDISAIASGPTVPGKDPAEAARAALAMLGRYALADRVPPAVLEALEARRDGAWGPEGEESGHLRAESPLRVENRLVGGNGPSLDAVVERARADGLSHAVVSRWLDGDVADAARLLHRAAMDADDATDCLLAGGETTVVLRGRGRGGRNQELALRFALLCEAEPIPREWVMLSGGTDGRDGPTEAAGGLVDMDLLPRLREGGVDVEAMLADNDAGTVLERGGGLLVTGPTGTNVADLQVIVLGGARSGG